VADRSATSTIISQALLATHALQELGVIASDETPTAADQEIALEKVGAVQDSLSALGIAFVAANEVPFAISEEVTKMAAIQLSTTFGKQGSLTAYKAAGGARPKLRHDPEGASGGGRCRHGRASGVGCDGAGALERVRHPRQLPARPM
jgi:hypothetical protein